MIFVDTSAWYGLVVSEDRHHAAAAAWVAANTEPLMVTDYVIDETLTLIRAKGHQRRAVELGQEFFHGTISVHYVTPDQIRAAWNVFRASDRWSFTDCASKVVMERLGVRAAFTFDGHFREFGSITVLPAP